MACGIAFAYFPAHLLWPVVHQPQHGNAGISQWIFLLPFTLFALFALTPVGMGLFLLVGQCRITVSGDRVTATDFAGPIFWRRKARLKDILRLQVGGAQAGSSVPPRTFAGVGLLLAVLKPGKLTVLAAGYPAEWVTALAGEISSLLKLQGTPVPVANVLGVPLTADGTVETVIQQPAGSRVTVRDTRGGVQLDIPSRGFWKESK